MQVTAATRRIVTSAFRPICPPPGNTVDVGFRIAVESGLTSGT